MNFKNYLLTVSCLCFVISCGGVAGKANAQISSEVSHVAIMIEKASKPFGYELIRGYPSTDEWEAEGTRNLLDYHAYYTLFGKDSDASCVGINGRIGVTVLLFKNAEIARRQIALRKEYHTSGEGGDEHKAQHEWFKQAGKTDRHYSPPVRVGTLVGMLWGYVCDEVGACTSGGKPQRRRNLHLVLSCLAAASGQNYQLVKFGT